MDKLLKQTENLLKLRNYSYKTAKFYLLYIKQYLIFSQKEKSRDKKEIIEKFLLEKIEKKNSPQTIKF